jgi:intracellular septation protein
MTTKPLHFWVKATLEFGPIIGFVVAYLIFKSETILIAGTEYVGFVAVIAAFIPIFLISIGALWFLTGRIARIQFATAVMLLVFGGLSIWLNDPRLFKMKPTAIYLVLALILSVGLLGGAILAEAYHGRHDTNETKGLDDPHEARDRPLFSVGRR